MSFLVYHTQARTIGFETANIFGFYMAYLKRETVDPILIADPKLYLKEEEIPCKNYGSNRTVLDGLGRSYHEDRAPKMSPCVLL